MVSWMRFHKVEHILNFLYKHSICSFLSSKIYRINTSRTSIITLIKCHKDCSTLRICKLKLHFIVSPNKLSVTRFSRSVWINQMRIKRYREVVWVKFSSKCREVFSSITIQLSPLIINHIDALCAVYIKYIVNIRIYRESLVIFSNKVFCIINNISKCIIKSGIGLLCILCIISKELKLIIYNRTPESLQTLITNKTIYKLAIKCSKERLNLVEISKARNTNIRCELSLPHL
nr:MAG TPA: hypothetical protein [Bacteriophage sp.]